MIATMFNKMKYSYLKKRKYHVFNNAFKKTIFGMKNADSYVLQKLFLGVK